MTSTIALWPWLVAGLATVAAGSFSWWLLDGLYAAWRRFRGMRRGRWQSMLARWRTYVEEDDRLPEADLYGLDEKRVRQVRLFSILSGLAAGGVVGLAWSPLGGVAVAAAGLAAPRLWLRALRRRREWVLLRQTRDFLTMLNLAAGLSGSLTWALRDLSNRKETLLSRRLAYHLERHSQPLAVLELTARDMRSEHLYDLVRRLRAVEHGGGDRREALKRVVEAISTDLQETAYEEVESAPMRLMFPMLVTLLPPVLAVILGPMVARMLAVISGEAF